MVEPQKTALIRDLAFILAMMLFPCYANSGSPIITPPVPNILKYLDPHMIYFNFAEIFGPLEQIFLIHLDPFEIIFPLNLYSTL